MYEDSYEIFEYLPIRVNTSEDEYIKHLWDAYVSLDSSGGPGRSFSVMTFHLLYMLALQYKLIRIYTEMPEKYNTAFIAYSGRDKESIIKPESVFDIGLLAERTIPDLFKIIDIDDAVIRDAKKLIDNRNDNLAHAKGGIEQNPEEKISEYLLSLRSIQNYCDYLNNIVADKWSLRIKENSIQDSELQNFIESQLLDSHLCPADFRTGKLSIAFKAYADQL